ncbi:MAG: hypothetical protein JW751_19600 [Polyangiaceae bacterium]|nr:hypothetical protein [Polyangiaceae bacterium]
MGRLYSWFLLGSALVLTVVRRLIRRDRAGEGRFREVYAAELPSGLSPKGSGLELGSCLACGLCERERSSSEANELGLMTLAIAGSRSCEELEALAPMMSRFEGESLGAKERACPTHFPFQRLQDAARQAGPGR